MRSYNFHNYCFDDGISDPCYDTVYSLEEEACILKNSIKEIQILWKTEENKAIEVQYPEIKITDWLKFAPIKEKQFDVGICLYKIYLHENTPELNQLMKRIEDQKVEMLKYLCEGKTPEGFKNVNWDEQKYFDLEQKFSESIKELKFHKAVVLSICVC